jgi:uncharacterized protein
MHARLCQFISEAVYDGRLLPEADNQKQKLLLAGNAHPALAETGITVFEVKHSGCSQKSEEEADAVRDIYTSLTSQRWTDRSGSVRPIGAGDILVVSPYNMQVNLIKNLLPQGARVGTVDKFQGQEAAVVLISMATSSADDLPRDLDFLYSRNRLNVALSRARCLAILVFNPGLLHVPCKTVQQMRLVNTLCWIEEYAAGIRSRPAPGSGFENQ